MLELKNLSFNVENGEGIIEIVDDINLYMEDGEILVITNPLSSNCITFTTS